MSYITDYSFFFHPTLRNSECTKIDDIAPSVNGVNWDGLTPDNADIILKELNGKEEEAFNEFRNAEKSSLPPSRRTNPSTSIRNTSASRKGSKTSRRIISS